MKKNFKRATFLAISSFIFSFNFVLADTCDELKPVLDKYYQASQDENIDSYMEVMDVDYLRENLLDNYEDYAKSAWDVYDTKEYNLKMYNCKKEESDAIAYFNLTTTLEAEGESVETQRNYVALFSKLDDWKIRYVMDEDIFSQFQSSLYTELFLDSTNDELEKIADDAETIVEYSKIEEDLLASDFENTVSEGVSERKTSQESDSEGGSKLMYFFILSLIVGAYLFIKNKKVSSGRDSD